MLRTGVIVATVANQVSLNQVAANSPSNANLSVQIAQYEPPQRRSLLY
jgi:hypothetical protein